MDSAGLWVQRERWRFATLKGFRGEILLETQTECEASGYKDQLLCETPKTQQNVFRKSIVF